MHVLSFDAMYTYFICKTDKIAIKCILNDLMTIAVKYLRYCKWPFKRL